MNRRALMLAVVLVVGTRFAWGYSGPGGVLSSSPQAQSQNQISTRLTTSEQRNFLRHCRYTAELARNHTHELLSSTVSGRLDRDVTRRHLSEAKAAIDRMFEDHKGLLYGLTEEQWAAAKEPITALERLRASIQVQLEGMELELQMPTPDPRVFAKYGKKLGASLEDWQRQHSKMAAAMGIKM